VFGRAYEVDGLHLVGGKLRLDEPGPNLTLGGDIELAPNDDDGEAAVRAAEIEVGVCVADVAGGVRLRRQCRIRPSRRLPKARHSRMAAFPWWDSVDSSEPSPHLARAAAWVGNAYVKTVLSTRCTSDAHRERTRRLLSDVIGRSSMPAWDDPVQMEAWLRGLLDACVIAAGDD